MVTAPAVPEYASALPTQHCSSRYTLYMHESKLHSPSPWLPVHFPCNSPYMFCQTYQLADEMFPESTRRSCTPPLKRALSPYRRCESWVRQTSSTLSSSPSRAPTSKCAIGPSSLHAQEALTQDPGWSIPPCHWCRRFVFGKPSSLHKYIDILTARQTSQGDLGSLLVWVYLVGSLDRADGA